MTTSKPRPSPRALCLAASIAWRHVTGDPVRAVLLAGRMLPGPARPWLRFAGPYGRAAALWGAGKRDAALAAVGASPRRLAAFSLAVDQPAIAASAVADLRRDDRARPVLTARLAWREGRLTEAIDALDGSDGAHGAHGVRGARARRLRRTLAAERAVFDGTTPRLPSGAPRKASTVPGRILHLVTDALPATSAGYTIRTHEIVLAQRAAGLDPHVVTRCGYPVTQGQLDGRRLVLVDGIPYHRLLPALMPGPADPKDTKNPRNPKGPKNADPMAADRGLALAAGLTERIRPAILHAASNFANARIALALGERYGLPVVYEVRGFWEDTWLSRHPDEGQLARSELYLKYRALETRCMLAADLVVTLGEAMREEIVARGVPADKVLVVPNAVSPEFLLPLPDASALRRELGIEPGEYVVGVVSTLTAYEGIGTLLEATGQLRDRGVPVRALIVGDGPERAALQRQATARGLGPDSGAAMFTGRVPAAKVREFHALLDIFVVPRTPDRVCQLVTPLKPVEAMASGLCVVTSEVKALTEIIKHEVTGTLTVPQDPVLLANCLERLLYSPDIRRKLGDNARQWVARDRTWAHNAARYQDAYARLGAK